ncbi:MAG: TIGR03435 family protein [Terracidiphilus sp.]
MYRIGGFPTTVATDDIRWDTLLQVLPMITACLTALAVTVSCWATQSAPEVASTQSRAYEVASIRPSAPDPSGAGQVAITGDHFEARNLSAKQLVYIAYDIYSPDLISNLPQWADSAQFDIEAKLEDDKAHGPEHEHSRVILRALLADRFKLKSHYERLDRPVYALVVDEHGPKVKEATAADSLEMSIQHGRIHLRAATMAPLVEGVSLMVERPVVDKTGLTGRYNIDLECTPDELEGTSDAGPSIFTVLREQLGLRLVSARSPINVLVIDQLERPSPN